MVDVVWGGGDGDAGGGVFVDDEGGGVVDGDFAGWADAGEGAMGAEGEVFLVLPGAEVAVEGADDEGSFHMDDVEVSAPVARGGKAGAQGWVIYLVGRGEER